MKIQNATKEIRFVIVGGINTAIDFGIFMLLAAVGLNPVVANYISTTTALSFSFFANRKYTFRATGGNLKREIVLFLIFTIFGLWVLQPIMIVLVQDLLDKTNIKEWLILLLAKLCATIVTLSWNYFTYSRFVFTQEQKHESKAP